MKADLSGRQRTTTDGFEDRGSGVRRGVKSSAEDRTLGFAFRRRLPLAADVRQLGCLLGCHRLCLKPRLVANHSN